ncbi:MAG: polymer-forming cytoskeletal protein [Oceanibaculum nanhaiense]|uniref:bactofilin family protein n=1 Tax=Oceanibaculum nanhaiense TaxID=1909734 RepID=UPI0025A3FEC1|nr:polymer-forming cytoskeletal protein [Oceanibaculum nanhaiense]MDM7946256.1 polymer-forming cytoskeletal protein [Oceanibaculum nanhaiense]
MPSIISANLRITGNLESEGDIQIDGVVEGDIRSSSLTVSDSATVRGAIEADTVAIAGSVTGQIKAKTVTLQRTARVIADIVQESLSIEPGAYFEGNLRRIAQEAPRKLEQPKLEQPQPGKSLSGPTGGTSESVRPALTNGAAPNGAAPNGLGTEDKTGPGQLRV